VIAGSQSKIANQKSKMSQPEISHRCPSCGAAVRERAALFCPECGKALKDNPADQTDTQPSAADDTSAPPPAAVKEPTPAAPAKIEADGANHPHRIAGRTRETLHRASAVASAAARGVMEEPVKRVEKIRTASTHVIEEAHYDPSLRFVLVAMGLFVVFLILLVLSKVMG